MGGIAGIGVVIFGVFWTIIAFRLTRGSPFPMLGIVFSLLGVLLVVFGIIMVISHFRNAAAKNRFSVIDINTSKIEPDPLNQLVSPKPMLEPSLSEEEKLGKLKELHKKGLISAAEHAAQRQRILDQI